MRSSDQAYEQNMQSARDIERRQGVVAAARMKVQAAALQFRPDPQRMPGVEAIQVFCNQRYGREIDAEALLRLRGDLCSACRLTADQADALSLVEVAAALKR